MISATNATRLSRGKTDFHFSGSCSDHPSSIRKPACRDDRLRMLADGDPTGHGRHASGDFAHHSGCRDVDPLRQVGRGFVSPVLLFFVVQAVIFFGVRLLRKKVEHTFTTSRANYVSLAVALLAVFGQLSLPS
jgi:hypothetical protein